MWPRKKTEPATTTTGQGTAADDRGAYNRYTFVRSGFNWREVGRYRVTQKKLTKDFERKDFCAVNRATASDARGPTSAVLLQVCAEVWESDPIPLESMCHVSDHWAAGAPSRQQSECFAQIDAMVQSAEAKTDGPPQVWHMPLDEKTVDDARRHCGMPVGDLADAARQIKDELEIAIMCERNAKSDAPRGIKAAITQFCQETKLDAEAAIRRMAQEARAGDFTVTCLKKRLRSAPPRA